MSPRYDYRCKKCKAYEIITHSFESDDQHGCAMEGCDGMMNKVISPILTIFKGPGFYKTDNR